MRYDTNDGYCTAWPLRKRNEFRNREEYIEYLKEEAQRERRERVRGHIEKERLEIIRLPDGKEKDIRKHNLNIWINDFNKYWKPEHPIFELP